MGKFQDLVGQKFGRLTVLEYLRNSKWLCICDCGKSTIVNTGNLKTEKVKSCGCLKKELVSNRRKLHGKTKTRLYQVWHNMKRRCYEKNNNRYKNYGGRGIKVCDKWLNDFQSFYDWAMINGYDESASRGICTIDRIDPNGNYCPENCRFVDNKIQANNRTNNHLITYNNETHTLSEWARILNIGEKNLCSRLTCLNWSIEKAFNVSKKRNFLYLSYNNKLQTIKQWAIELNIPYYIIYGRLKRGWNIEKIFATPYKKIILQKSY